MRTGCVLFDALTISQGYQILEEDCQISLADFAERFGRGDGEPESVVAPMTLSALQN